MTTRLVGDYSSKTIPAYEEQDEKETLTPTAASVNEDKPPLGEPLNFRRANGFTALLRWWDKPKLHLDSIATQPSVFDEPGGLERYRPPPQYENTHRFDYLARWTWREEKVKTSFDVLFCHPNSDT